MHFNDFEYDGQLLSDLGYVVVSIDNESGVDRMDSGSKITFNTFPILHGASFALTSTQYDECLTATFDICKDPCVFSDLEISDYEFRNLMRWLNRKSFCVFKPLDDSIHNCFYNASFNIQKIYVCEKLYGLELTMETDSPFAYGSNVIYNISLNSGDTYDVYDESDEEGFVYPKLKISVKEDGDLIISNAFDYRDMVIKGCVAGETLYIDYPMISSSNTSESRNLPSQFNWHFLRISNSFNRRKNTISTSLSCDIELSYNPILKAGI